MSSDKSFCVCYSSRVGSLIIGILFIVGCVPLLGYCIHELLVSVAQSYNESRRSDAGSLTFSQVVLREGRSQYLTVIVVYFLILLINLGLSCLMCYGTVRRQGSKCLPWLYFNCGTFMHGIIIFSMFVQQGEEKFVIPLATYLIVHFYMLYVVHSYTRNTSTLDSEEHRNRNSGSGTYMAEMLSATSSV